MWTLNWILYEPIWKWYCFRPNINGLLLFYFIYPNECLRYCTLLWTYHLSFNLSFNLWQKRNCLSSFLSSSFSGKVWPDYLWKDNVVTLSQKSGFHCMSRLSSLWRTILEGIAPFEVIRNWFEYFFCLNLNYDGNFSTKWYYFNSPNCMYKRLKNQFPKTAFCLTMGMMRPFM